MKKKLISLLLVLSTMVSLFSIAPVTVVAEASAEEVSSHLIAHWDFEGTGDEALRDKAPAGGAVDTMKTYGTVTVGNGTAYIPDYKNGSNTHALYVSDSADTFRTTENRTIYMRWKSDHVLFATDGKPDVLRLATQNGAIHLGINNGDDKPYGSTNVGNISENPLQSNGMYYAPNTWITMAVAYDKSAGSGAFTITTFFKTDGGDWVTGSVTRTDAAQTWVQNDYTQNAINNSLIDHNSLIFGRQLANLASGWGGNITFDDIRIYDKALTAEEIKLTDSLESHLISHWDFEGTGDEILTDKAHAGSNKDTLYATNEYVTFENGIAYIPDNKNYTNTNALYAYHSNDLFRTTADRTLYMRFKSDHGLFSTDGKDDRLVLASQNDAIHLGIDPSDDKLYGSTSVNSVSENWVQTNGMLYQSDTWITMAVSYEKNDDGTFTIYSFFKPDGGEWVTGTAKKTGTEATSQTWVGNDYGTTTGPVDQNALIFGRRRIDCTSSWGGNISIDDIRVYDKALTLEEVRSISSSATVSLMGRSLSLGGDIGVNFYLYADPTSFPDDPEVTIVSGERELMKESFSAVAQKVSNGQYKITARVAAKEMTDVLTFRIKSEGKIIYADTYSVKQYAETILANSDSQYSKDTLDLVRALLNYGGYAQSYFAYQTENLANTGLNLKLPVPITSNIVDSQSSGTVAGIEAIGATLGLENKTQIVFVIRLAEGAKASDYSFAGGEVAINGRTVTVTTEGVRADKLDHTYTLTVSKGGVAQTLTYSPMNYVKNKIGDTNAELVSLLKSLYAYYTAAKQYQPDQIVNNGIITYTPGAGLLYNGIKETTPTANSMTSDAVVTPSYLIDQSAGGTRPDVIDITVGRQLFVDDFLIAQSSGISTVYHQAQKYEVDGKTASIFTPTTQEWAAGTSAGGVWYDMEAKKYKMWYDIGFNPGLGYAESDDGINWTRVNVDGTDSNVVFGTMSPSDNNPKNGVCSVFIDYETENVSERYKMFVHSMTDISYGQTEGINTGADRLPGDVDRHSYLSSLFVSADGLHWVQKGSNSLGGSGDMTTAHYNAFKQTWVNSLRGYIPGVKNDSDTTNDNNARARWFYEADNFEDLVKWRTNDAIFWMKTDALDATAENGKDSQTYNFSAIAYESIMLGSHTIWYGPENDIVDETATPKRNELQLAYSRDGYSYDRPSREAFIGTGNTRGEVDYGYLFSTIGGLIVKDDLLYIYYSGFSGKDSSGNNAGHATQSIGLATLRRDGFASLDGGENSYVWTRKLTVNGDKKYLFVNIDVPEGSFAASVVDKNGNVYEGFEMSNCVTVGGDDTCAQITWKNGKDLSFLNGEEFYLRFSMQKGGSFYSFWLSDSLGGESGGAVGAGYAGQ